MAHHTLTPAEIERLECLAGEAGEIVQAAMEVLRHGYEPFNPFDHDMVTNRRHLARELGNLTYVTDRMLEERDIGHAGVQEGVRSKEVNWALYTHHQPESNKGETQ